MSKQPTWNDFQEAKPAELKKTYKLNDRQLEMAHRKHLGGAKGIVRHLSQGDRIAS